jgi:hypothetical protein
VDNKIQRIGYIIFRIITVQLRTDLVHKIGKRKIEVHHQGRGSREQRTHTAFSATSLADSATMMG